MLLVEYPLLYEPVRLGGGGGGREMAINIFIPFKTW